MPIKRLFLLLCVPALLLNLSAPARADVWDVMTWNYIRVWTDWFNFTNIYTGDGCDVVKKPGLDEFADSTKTNLMEMRQWDYDNNVYKIRFTFDGSALSLNNEGLSSVGGSSELRYALRLSGSWATIGTVSNGVLTPDPYASFISTGYGSGYVNWSADTPQGYSTQLLLGFNFQDNGPATYKEDRWPYYSVTATMALDRYLPKMYNQSHSYRQVNPHAFSVTYGPVVPEPSSLGLIAGGLGWIMISSRRR